MKTQHTKKDPLDQFLKNIEKFALTIKDLSLEIYYGTIKNTFPWLEVSLVLFAIMIAFVNDVDIRAAEYLKIEKFYNSSIYPYWIHFGCWALLVIFGFAAREYGKKRRFLSLLTEVFLGAGLKNRIGKIPNFISDFPIDGFTRKLNLHSNSIPLKEFHAQKDHLEAGLGVYIDEIREVREQNVIEVIYSFDPMPDLVDYFETTESKNFSVVVGKNRAKEVFQDFRSSPHLLVAGQTGGGKSTFLRSLITSLYLNHNKATFKLIDLKEGLEFQTFKGVSRIQIIDDMDALFSGIGNLDHELNERMNLLKSASCKDIDDYKRKRKSENKKPLEREFIVIDEAAEIFLTNSSGNIEQVQKARKALSRIARLGRACGLHLIVATQRPDAKAIDSQVKANLTSILCFQMANLHSSLTVLGNGRAKDLPAVPGRAIWKSGFQIVEIQTPLLSEGEARELLKPYLKSDKDNDVIEAKPSSNQDVSEKPKDTPLPLNAPPKFTDHPFED